MSTPKVTSPLTNTGGQTSITSKNKEKWIMFAFVLLAAIGITFTSLSLDSKLNLLGKYNKFALVLAVPLAYKILSGGLKKLKSDKKDWLIPLLLVGSVACLAFMAVYSAQYWAKGSTMADIDYLNKFTYALPGSILFGLAANFIKKSFAEENEKKRLKAPHSDASTVTEVSNNSATSGGSSANDSSTGTIDPSIMEDTIKNNTVEEEWPDARLKDSSGSGSSAVSSTAGGSSGSGSSAVSSTAGGSSGSGSSAVSSTAGGSSGSGSSAVSSTAGGSSGSGSSAVSSTAGGSSGSGSSSIPTLSVASVAGSTTTNTLAPGEDAQIRQPVEGTFLHWLKNNPDNKPPSHNTAEVSVASSASGTATTTTLKHVDSSSIPYSGSENVYNFGSRAIGISSSGNSGVSVRPSRFVHQQ